MSVVIAYEDTGPCRKQLTIEVPAPAVEAELSRVERELAHNVRIRGFRQGKVPLSLVRQRFREEIDQRVTDRLVPRYWHQAQAEKSLDPLLPPQITDLHIEAGEPMTFVAEVEVRPEIRLDLDAPFDLPEKSVEPTPEEIEETFENLRRQHASWRPVERAAAVGDRVVGEIRPLTADGESEEPPQPLAAELGGEGVPEELTLALTGLAAEQHGELERTVGEGDESRQVKYRITVDAVEEQELPELDDAFAARLGEFEDLAALREAIVAQLRQRKSSAYEEESRRALLEQLRQRHPLELPGRLVDREAERMLTDFAENLAGRGVDVESPDFDWQSLGEQMRPQAEHRVHDRLLLDAIADQREVKVDEQVFEGLLRSIAAQQQKSALALRQELAESGGLDHLRAQLRRDQALRSLLGEDSTEDSTEDAGDGGEADADDEA